MTKRELDILKQHARSNLFELTDCYQSYSILKQHAYNYELNIYNSRLAYEFRIISYNGYMFSVGFYFVKDNKLFFHYASNRTTKEFPVDIVPNEFSYLLD